MDIFSIFTLFGGLAFFLFGMNLMSSCLKKVAGGKMQGTLEKMTSSKLRGLILGMVITIAIQSSSALTVMLVGFVNSGIMQLSQTIPVIMGSNIGTTLTSWILSMNGIQSDNFLISLLKPEHFSPIVAFIGVILVLSSKSSKKKDLGTIFCGFAVLMYGMTMMSGSVEPLAEMPGFQKALVAFDNPFLGLLIGVAFTGVIQSSAASIGILQAFALTGNISCGMAIPIVMGANIGTCVTALLSAIGVSRKAKRVSLIHVWINIIGAAIWMSIYCILRYLAGMAFFNEPMTSFQIAVFHSIFNVGTVLILLPFTDRLVRLIEHILPVLPEEETQARPMELLDRRLFVNPPLAVETAMEKTMEMASGARDAFSASMDVVKEYSESQAKKVLETEDYLDYLEDQLDTFLIRLSAKNVTEEDNNSISEMLHCINDFERISDHAANMTNVAGRLVEDKLTFSPAARAELVVLHESLDEILGIMTDSYLNDDEDMARHAEPLRDVIDSLVKEIKNRHIDRLQTGECSGEMGVVLNDILTYCDRVADLCASICTCVIQTRYSSLEMHNFEETLREGSDQAYLEEYAMYEQKYSLSPYTPLKKKKKKKKDKDKKKDKNKSKNAEKKPDSDADLRTEEKDSGGAKKNPGSGEKEFESSGKDSGGGEKDPGSAGKKSGDADDLDGGEANLKKDSKKEKKKDKE